MMTSSAASANIQPSTTNKMDWLSRFLFFPLLLAKLRPLLSVVGLHNKNERKEKNVNIYIIVINKVVVTNIYFIYVQKKMN